jgi:pimeloyl-ACP methyl ester carboxylesterase
MSFHGFLFEMISPFIGGNMPQLPTSAMPVGFTETTAEANGIRLNYARGGSGPAVVLLHGYPQTWYMWRKVMPALAERYTVIAPDLRGSGGSDAPDGGYDKATLAEDVHQLLAGLGLADQVNVVGHDIGTMVAYAYAAAHRGTTRRLVLTEAPQMDERLYQFPAITPQGPGLWNFGYFILPNGLPERMVAGREDAWVDGFVDSLEQVKGGVGEEAIAEYAESLRQPGRLRASFEYFRAYRRDVDATIANRATTLDIPVLALGGAAVGQVVGDQAAAYATDVTSDVLPCGHWIAEEIPDVLTERLLAFLR